MANVNFPNPTEDNDFREKYSTIWLTTNNSRQKFKKSMADRKRNTPKTGFGTSLFRTSSSDPILQQFNQLSENDTKMIKTKYSELIRKISILKNIYENAPDIFNNLKEIIINNGSSKKINIEKLIDISVADLNSLKSGVDKFLKLQNKSGSSGSFSFFTGESPTKKKLKLYTEILINNQKTIMEKSLALSRLKRDTNEQFKKNLQTKLPKCGHCDDGIDYNGVTISERNLEKAKNIKNRLTKQYYPEY